MAFPPRAPRGAFNPRFKKEQQQEHRTNHMIKVPQVRLVGENIDSMCRTPPNAGANLYSYVVPQQIFCDDADNSLLLNNNSLHQVP